MKKFFAKVWEAIKSAFAWIASQLGRLASAAYHRLLAISPARWYDFSLGLIITAFSAITLGVEFPPILTIFAGIFHAAYKMMTDKPLNWKTYAALAIGAAIVEILVIL